MDALQRLPISFGMANRLRPQVGAEKNGRGACVWTLFYYLDSSMICRACGLLVRTFLSLIIFVCLFLYA